MLKHQFINQHCLLITKEEKLRQILFPSSESYLTGRKQWIFLHESLFDVVVIGILKTHNDRILIFGLKHTVKKTFLPAMDTLIE